MLYEAAFVVENDFREVIKHIRSLKQNRSYIIVNGARYPFKLKDEKEFSEKNKPKYWENSGTLYLVFSVKRKPINKYYVHGIFEDKILESRIPSDIYVNLMKKYPFDRMNDYEGRMLQNVKPKSYDQHCCSNCGRYIEEDEEEDIHYPDPTVRQMIEGLIFYEECEEIDDNIWLISLGS